MKNEIEDRIKNIMSVVFQISVDEIKEELSPDTIDTWDSLKHMNLVIALEEEFDFELTDSETVEILSFKLILEVLKDYGY